MDNEILIGDFVKLTGSTLKTVLYYHKIGLLEEHRRNSGGYRLYGAQDLTRMRMIKHLKNLGMGLQEIKGILGNVQDHRTLSQVLLSLQAELTIQKNNIEQQLSSIELLLEQDIKELEETAFQSESFKLITEILGPEKVENYKEACPELYDQQSKVFSIMDDFQWDKEYKENLGKIAEYFKMHPEKYKEAMEFAKRRSKLRTMCVDDPEIESLAMEGAAFIKNEPVLKELLYGKKGFETTKEELFNEISNKFLSPAEIKHKQLIQKFLDYRP